MPTAVIVDAVLTPSGRGNPGGVLSGVHPVNLGALVLSAVLERNGLDSRPIDHVLMTCVSQVGDQGTNLARNAVLAAGFNESIPGTTIDRQCGSSQQAAHFAAQGVMAGAHDMVITGGVESKSRVPLGSSNTDGWPTSPGLRRRYPDGLMNPGASAEPIAAKWGFDREAIDEFSARSHHRAAGAGASGRFSRELIPVAVVAEDGTASEQVADETVRASTTAEKLAGLPLSFRDERIQERLPPDRMAHHTRELLSTDRWRLRNTDHGRGEGQRTRTHAACAVPFLRRHRRRPALHAHRPHSGDPPHPGAIGAELPRSRRLRGERGVRAGAPGTG